MKEGQIASWRGRNIGVVFQFFQLLPTPIVLETVMLSIDFCNVYSGTERRQQAIALLKRVDMTDHLDKLPIPVANPEVSYV